MTDTNNIEEKEKKVKPKKVEAKKFDDLEGKFLLVRVGSKDEPATDEQIKTIEEKLVNFLEENKVSCLVFVTHHAVSMEIIEKQKGNSDAN